MPFSSFLYIFVFLPVSVAGFLAVRRMGLRAAKLWLLVCSIVFYATTGIGFVPVLIASIALNYTVSYFLSSAGESRRLLIWGIVANVVLLCLFKYAGFAVGNVNFLFGTHFHAPSFGFPAGVSFFTIQQIMYIVDRADGLVEHQDPLDHAVFVAFFPYVLMGPICKVGDVMPQLTKGFYKPWNNDDFARSVFILLIGLFKKLVLADTFGRWANLGFAYSGPLSFAGSWLSAIAFTFQLYFDFSGYCDMAMGSALLLNVNLPQNFDSPFRSQGIIEFWRRWHMTLTAFITTYLYTPIVRSFRKITFGKAMFATFASMAIAGLWHGAAWTYVVFGMMHGVALVINNWARRRKLVPPRFVCHLLTGFFLVFGFVVFRAGDLVQAGAVMHSMVLPSRFWDLGPFEVIDATDRIVGVLWMLIGIAVSVAGPSSIDLMRSFQPSGRKLAFAAVTACITILYLNSMVSLGFVYRDF